MKSTVMAVTLGDPGGIGPEVTLKAIGHLKRKASLGRYRFLLIGSLSVLECLNKKIGARLKFKPFGLNQVERDRDFFRDCIRVFDVPASEFFLEKAKRLASKNIKPGALNFAKGQVSPLNGLLALESVNWGVDFCMRGLADALVTAPLNKAAVREVLPSFDGHTEYLRKRSGARHSCMMFAAGRLKMTLVTMHLPLKDVSRALNQKLIQEKIGLTYDGLRKLFGIPKPRIGVSALNPHGSEFGGEEERIIRPAIEKCAKRIPNLAGPIPGDEIFRELWEGKWDAVVAMYHDQGLGPFKMIAFRSGVNLTLGLPFVRTSPDHGTAFDIAYRNKADFHPMLAAIELAGKLVVI